MSSKTGGRPREGKTERLHLRVKPETKQSLLSESHGRGWTMNRLIDHLVWTAFEHDERIRNLEATVDAQKVEIQELFKVVKRQQATLDRYKNVQGARQSLKQATQGGPTWL